MIASVAQLQRMEITHNIAEQRFECRQGGDLAVCEYLREGSVWDLHHTFVPAGLRGTGVAGALAKAALEHVKQQGGAVRPSCSYIATYIKRHPQYAELVVPGE